MARKYILANTLTWHFIYFAKLMGIYPRIREIYKEVGNVCKKLNVNYADDISFFRKMSFYDYVDLFLRHDRKHLNEDFIKVVYFFGNYGYYKFRKHEINELTELFLSYLKDKRIYRNLRIDRS